MNIDQQLEQSLGRRGFLKVLTAAVTSFIAK